jgi:hypothetical protein
MRVFHQQDLGDVVLFVVPVDRDGKALRYEAVINRL